jgi:tetratricopeptide (TPR) repeat protein
VTAFLLAALLALPAAAGEPRACRASDAKLKAGGELAGKADDASREKAEAALKEAAGIARGEGCAPGRLIAALDALARLYESQERYPLAVRARADSLGVFEKAHGDGSPEHAEAEARLAETYRKSGQVVEAAAHYERALAALAKTKKHKKRVAELEAVLAELKDERQRRLR